MTRTDDIINVNGVRISTGALEEIILQNKNVAECAVVGIENKLSGKFLWHDFIKGFDHNAFSVNFVVKIFTNNFRPNSHCFGRDGR